MFATNPSTTPPSIPIQSPLQCLLLFNDCPSCLMARHLDGQDSDEGYQEKESERFHLVVFQIDVNLVWVLQTRSLKLDNFTQPVLVSFGFQMWCCCRLVQGAIWCSVRPRYGFFLDMWSQARTPDYFEAWKLLQSTLRWPEWKSKHRNFSAPSSHLWPEWQRTECVYSYSILESLSE